MFVAVWFSLATANAPDNCPPSGPTPAKPSGNHIALGGFVRYEHFFETLLDASNLDARELLGRDRDSHDRLALPHWLGREEVVLD